jgi:hypothetical protein
VCIWAGFSNREIHSCHRTCETATNAKKLREWRISIMRDRSHDLGRVVAPDKEAAVDKRWKNSGLNRRAASEPVE